MPISFNIDKQKLFNNYLLLQKQYHPDNAANQRESINFSHFASIGNNAYTTLENDLERAIYLLRLNNINLDNYKLDQTLLAPIWQEYEKAEELQKTELLESFYIEKLAQLKTISANLDELFQRNIQEAAKQTMIFKYITNLVDKIKMYRAQA